MSILLNLLAIPIGALTLATFIFLISVVVVVVEYPLHVFTILSICLIGYAIGINIMTGLGWL